MVPEDTEGNRIGPNVQVRCKTDTYAGANVMPISLLGGFLTRLLSTIIGFKNNQLK